MASLLLTILTFFSCSITEKEPTLDNEIVAYLGKMAELFENKDLKGQSELFAKNHTYSQKIITADLLMLSFLPSVT